MSEPVAECADWSLRGGASSWNKLFDRYYRKFELFPMQWGSLDLSNMIVSAAQYAGPLGNDTHVCVRCIFINGQH